MCEFGFFSDERVTFVFAAEMFFSGEGVAKYGTVLAVGRTISSSEREFDE